MRRATSVIPKAERREETVSGRIRLDYDHRHRRRVVLNTEAGEPILLDLPLATHLHDGDGLLLDDGRVIVVEALPEPLLDIAAPDIGALVRIAWHLGNRHLPTQLMGHALRIRDDHVLREMIHILGGTTTKVIEPFDPEGGAYAGLNLGEHHHGHDNG